jgi:tetratricopeptide (TPR) repeat protein
VILKRSARLHDPNIEGFHSLARGRMATRHRDPERAIESLALAIQQLEHAGRHPWCVYARIEYAKALMDQQRFDESADLLDHINEEIDRYQVLLPWYEEARGQHHRLINREDIASAAFQSAVDYAEKMGMPRRAEVYRGYIDGTSPE